MSDTLDKMGSLIEDLFKVLNEEISAINWRLNFKPEKQAEGHWLNHRLEVMMNHRNKLLKQLNELAKNGTD